MDPQVAPGLARVHVLPLIFRDDRTGPYDQRAKLCKLRDHGVRKSEFIKVRAMVLAEILERQDRDALFLGAGCRRSNAQFRNEARRVRHRTGLAGGCSGPGLTRQPVERPLTAVAVAVARPKDLGTEP